MKKAQIRLITLCSVLFCGVMSPIVAQQCKGIPQFMIAHGFDPARSAMSSQENRKRGVVLIELSNMANPGSTRNKFYQHPSWLLPGYAGSITTGRNGDIYVLPKANVNMLYNPPENQNTIYRIDNKTGILTSWVKIPMPRIPDEHNASGLLSAFYDCDTDALIVSTVAGSRQKEEIGAIYSVKASNGETTRILDKTDVLGLLTANLNNERRLLYGSARRSEIWSVALDASNHVTGAPRLEILLEGLGPRGDDKARKLRMDTNGMLQVFGVPFYYNLTAPVERQETVYVFEYSSVKKVWTLKSMN